MADKPDKLPAWIGQILCRLGLHDFQLIEEIGSFGPGGGVQKLACRRCGETMTRHG